ncbi:hypothetical protein LR010_02490 [Candidatus Gracilibacteria bacterium]|nr:hypothetical protein [Candidatus Gracilibacteria bacterium]
MNKNLALTLSLTAIIIAFFLGYFYAHREYILEREEKINQIRYIDINTTTKNITIKNTPENIRFRVGGEIIHTGSVELK